MAKMRKKKRAEGVGVVCVGLVGVGVWGWKSWENRGGMGEWEKESTCVKILGFGPIKTIVVVMQTSIRMRVCAHTLALPHSHAQKHSLFLSLSDSKNTC